MSIIASACGVQVDDQVGLVEQSAADQWVRFVDIDCATEVTAITRRPR
jgi:hypothetical protein